MHRLKTLHIALIAGVIAAAIGLVAFALNWHFPNFWSGAMPGVTALLFPGHLTLVYLWHPLFTEEINFWPKLLLLMLGQFLLTSGIVALCLSVAKRCRKVAP